MAKKKSARIQIRERRKVLQITQRDLSEKLVTLGAKSCSVWLICQIETGKMNLGEKTKQAIEQVMDFKIV